VGRAGIGNKSAIRKIKKTWQSMSTKQKKEERKMMQHNLDKYA